MFNVSYCPIADQCRDAENVRFVPKTEIAIDLSVDLAIGNLYRAMDAARRTESALDQS